MNPNFPISPSFQWQRFTVLLSPCSKEGKRCSQGKRLCIRSWPRPMGYFRTPGKESMLAGKTRREPSWELCKETSSLWAPRQRCPVLGNRDQNKQPLGLVWCNQVVAHYSSKRSVAPLFKAGKGNCSPSCNPSMAAGQVLKTDQLYTVRWRQLNI